MLIAACVWLVCSPEGGVRLSNDMGQYALDYLSSHQLLESGEELVAYYDATISLDGTEAAILTTKRIIYHKGGRSESIDLSDIEDIRHTKEVLIGDVFVIDSASGKPLKIEIAPLNQGGTFKAVLMKAWQRAKEPAADGTPKP